ncbi:MAG: AraC family transcriptional regulator [Flavobacteriales bacterium]|nr:AraC family transcriptional regulator [Flavobacteriales bacterium]
MNLDFLDLLSVLVIFASTLLAIFLLSANSEIKRSNFVLASFLLINAVDEGSQFISFMFETFPGFQMFIRTFIFLKMPLLFVYIHSILYSDFAFKWKQVIHLLPWIIVNIIFVPRFYSVNLADKLTFFETNNLEIWISYFIIHIQVFLYITISFILIRRHRNTMLENYSDPDAFHHKWLFQLVTIFALESIIASAKNIFMLFNIESAFDFTMIMTSIIGFVFVTWIVLKALYNPKLFIGIISKSNLINNPKFDNQNSIDNSDPNNEEIKNDIIKLKQFMVDNEPYLNPSLSIQSLATSLNMSSHELSTLINRYLNIHFFDFINGYRIDKAMEILKDPRKKDLTILEILYEVGFNSKSSFNTAFKKHTNLTPTQYRQRAQIAKLI